MTKRASKTSQQFTGHQCHQWHLPKQRPDCLIMDCPEYDPFKDFKRDRAGFYVLIRPNFATCRIELALCNKDHEVVAIFSGRKCQDLYAAIFRYEAKSGLNWFTEKTHSAYLGKELKKAELALSLGNSAYFQE